MGKVTFVLIVLACSLYSETSFGMNIAVYGDSTSEGWQLKQGVGRITENNVPALLQQSLRKAISNPVIVENKAVGGTQASQLFMGLDGKNKPWRDEMANRHRAILAEWEADGNTIEPYEAPPPSAADVDAERDRRIDGGFYFGGFFYQSRPEDRENIAGASTAALAAIMNGSQPGDYRWHGGDEDFVWIAEDNSLMPMDAQTLFAFGQAAMEHKQAHIFAARAIKDADPIPADFTDDAYWP